MLVAAPSSCPSQEFKCVTSGEWISLGFVCGGEEDCVDGSDEERACDMWNYRSKNEKQKWHIYGNMHYLF